MIGERVRLAREACRLTQTQLAEATGIAQGRLSDLEAGRILDPKREMVESVARATVFPISFFYLGALPDFPEGHNRRLKRGTTKVAKQIRAQVRQVVELVQRSEAELRLPSVMIDAALDIPDLDRVERCAEEVRSILGIGARDPIGNVMRAVERAGVVIVGLPTEMEDHDGFSAWPDYGLDGRPIIAYSPGHSGDRDRFTISHELGHLILHTRRHDIDATRAEDEANRFASAFLIPEESARRSMYPPVTLRTLIGVKATYGVSIAMTVRRARDLSIIDQNHYVSLCKQLSTRGWRKREPVEVTSEKPLLISKILGYLAGEGPVAQRAQRVAMPVFWFRALADAN